MAATSQAGDFYYTGPAHGSIINSNNMWGTVELRLNENKDFQKLQERLSKIEERLAILEPNEELQEKYPALQEAYEHYKLIEKLVSGNKKD